MVGSKFGEATEWGGIALHVYIKYKYSNYYLWATAKSFIDLFSLKINQSINSCSHEDWLSLQLHEDPFSIDTQSQCWQPFLSHWIPQKSFYTIQTWKASSHRSSLQVGIRQTSLQYGASVLNIDRTSQLSYWLNSHYHGNQGGICLHCLPEDSSTICWSTLLPQVLYPIGIGSAFCY